MSIRHINDALQRAHCDGGLIHTCFVPCADGASQQIQAIPEEEPLRYNSLPKQQQQQQPDAASQPSSDAGGDGDTMPAASAPPPGKQSALRSAVATTPAGDKLRVSFAVEGSQCSADGSQSSVHEDKPGVPLDEESGGMPQPWLRSLRWLKVRKMPFYRDIGSGGFLACCALTLISAVQPSCCCSPPGLLAVTILCSAFLGID